MKGLRELDAKCQAHLEGSRLRWDRTLREIRRSSNKLFSTHVSFYMDMRVLGHGYMEVSIQRVVDTKGLSFLSCKKTDDPTTCHCLSSPRCLFHLRLTQSKEYWLPHTYYTSTYICWNSVARHELENRVSFATVQSSMPGLFLSLISRSASTIRIIHTIIIRAL